MVMGGIPHYLKEIDGGKSATQNINDMLRNKMAVFRAITHTRKHLMPVLIAPFGVCSNAWSLELTPVQLSLDDLFGYVKKR